MNLYEKNSLNLTLNFIKLRSSVTISFISKRTKKMSRKQTSIHLRWESTELQDNAITFTPNLLNSGISFTTRANSVVQTGVKSLGWENRIPHLYFGQTSHVKQTESSTIMHDHEAIIKKIYI